MGPDFHNGTTDDLEKCFWKDVASKVYTSQIGSITAVLCLWVSAAILFSRLRYEMFYRNFLNYTVVATVRRGLPSLTRMVGLKFVYECGTCDVESCKMLAFWDNFLAVYEFESLTHICIERYIFTTYTHNGRVIPKWHNTLFSSISFCLALVYSSLPLLGFGRYCKDLTCRYCAVDLILPEEPFERIVYLLFFFLQYYKPVIAMIFFLGKAVSLHRNEMQKQYKYWLTKGICVMAVLHVAFWMPFVLAKTTVLLVQILGHDTDLKSYTDFIQFGMYWESWCVGMAVVGYLLCDHFTLLAMVEVIRGSCDASEPKPDEETKRE